MSRDAENKAGKVFGKSMGNADVTGQRSNETYANLYPLYNEEARNPQGFAPEDLAAMNTASQDSVGGAISGAVGQGDLEAARTRNEGGFAPALDESVLSGMRVNSKNALDTQARNAMLKETNRQSGIAGLQELHDLSSQQVLSSLGLGTGATNAQVNAGKSGWFQNMTELIRALNPGYSKATGPTVGG